MCLQSKLILIFRIIGSKWKVIIIHFLIIIIISLIFAQYFPHKIHISRMAVIMWPISWLRYQDEDHFTYSVVIGQMNEQAARRHQTCSTPDMCLLHRQSTCQKQTNQQKQAQGRRGTKYKYRQHFPLSLLADEMQLWNRENHFRNGFMV